MTIVLPDDLSQQLQQLAKQHNQSPETLVRKWLQSQLAPEVAPQPRTPDLGQSTIWVSDGL